MWSYWLRRNPVPRTELTRSEKLCIEERTKYCKNLGHSPFEGDGGTERANDAREEKENTLSELEARPRQERWGLSVAVPMWLRLTGAYDSCGFLYRQGFNLASLRPP